MGFETFKIWHTRTHTHTSGRQLKIKFLDVLDYSEYSDTNISKFFFHKKTFSVTKQKQSKLQIDCILVHHYFVLPLTKPTLSGSLLINFGCVMQEVPSICYRKSLDFSETRPSRESLENVDNSLEILKASDDLH